LQLCTEGSLVAITATAGGLAIALATIRCLVRLAPADIPRLADAALDLNSFFFAAATASVAAIACSAIPGFTAARISLEAALREGGSRTSMSGGSGSTRNVFVVTQTGLTAVLLVLAALLVLSYRSMLSAETGFANRDALSVSLPLRGPGLFSSQGDDLQARRAFYSRLLERLRQAPGVTSAAAVLMRPLEGAIGWDVGYEFEFEAGLKENRVLPKANYEVVTPGYFQTVGTALLEGRDFDEHDSEGADSVVIVSRALARRIRAAGYSAIGYRIRLGLGSARWLRIVGVCADARYRNLTQTGADLFVPYGQARAPTNYVVVRGTRSASDLLALVRQTLAGIDRSQADMRQADRSQADMRQAVASPATIGELVDANAARHRFNMVLLLWFGVCATALAAMGVYSVVRETISGRRREIAIRSALGAGRMSLVGHMLARTLRFVVLGEVLGTAVLATTGRSVADLLYGVTVLDPGVLSGVALFVFAASLLAAWTPAWRAAGADPSIDLRAG
ncbi:MAG TPA: ABC transporter permease, partial [Bryobacteraceae bacterium]|nr:ABC transporter permease [Bryobacteraceae bacterium]